MSRSVATRSTFGAAFAATATLLLPGCSVPTKPAGTPPPASADTARHFGFPRGFSPSTMDVSADPRQDFRRYAGGRWLDAAQIPADQLEISGYLVMQEEVETQLRDLLQGAAQTSGAAPNGSPAQQVGDFYASVRDWWTPADAQRFVAETAKLARQADAFEILPGLRLNGALEATENLADVGGVALGCAALQEHLREHPADNRTIDGFSPSQRCFLAWGQLWAAKKNEGAMRQNLPTDGHPPGLYRTAAPSQHEKVFYEAFGIRAGDRMWLDPSDRVTIW